MHSPKRCSNGSLTADFHEIVRDAAAIAIARIDPTQAAARRGLELLLQHADDPQGRSRAALALGQLGDRTANPALIRALENGTDVHEATARLAGEHPALFDDLVGRMLLRPLALSP